MALSANKKRAIALAIGGAELFLSQFRLPEIVEVLKSTALSSILGQLARDPTLVGSGKVDKQPKDEG